MKKLLYVALLRIEITNLTIKVASGKFRSSPLLQFEEVGLFYKRSYVTLYYLPVNYVKTTTENEKKTNKNI